jgi:mannose-1-phosphate guanylyltransferase
VDGRSILEWNLRWLLAAGLSPLWINLHYRAGAVRRAVEGMDLRGGEIRFSYEDPILGTAGAWRHLAGQWDGTTLVVYGDNLARFDLGAFVAAHRAAPAVTATVALFDPARHANTGIAGSRVVVADGRVTGFEEIRGSAAGRALVHTGACLLEPALAERIVPGYADFGADVFPALVADGALAAHVIEDGGFCLGLDTPEHFEVGQGLVEGGQVRLERERT